MRRSRALPRRVRAVRVDRSKRSHFVETKEAALRVRTSETAAIMLERMTLGRSLMVVVVVETAILDTFCAHHSCWISSETDREKGDRDERILS